MIWLPDPMPDASRKNFFIFILFYFNIHYIVKQANLVDCALA